MQKTMNLDMWTYPPYIHSPQGMELDLCDKIKEEYESELFVAKILDEDSPYVQKQVRQSDCYFLDINDENSKYFTFVQYLMDVNKYYYGFDLTRIEVMQLTRYQEGGHYNWHMDNMGSGAANRKLSFTVNLSHEDEYEGGDLEIMMNSKDPIKLSREKGTMNVFPSFMLHRVTPVTKGTRWSLVGWACGKRFE